jgi:beta-N-acetylhexosaminidase
VAGTISLILASLLLAGSAAGREQAHKASSVDRLTQAQLVGQRVILSYSGPAPPDALFDQIRRGRVAGVIFFGENITSPQQIAQTNVQLQEAVEHSVLPRALRRPLLLMTDQEGGIVRRLPGPPDLSEAQIGVSPDRRHVAAQAGRGAGENLGSVGMNVNLAPVLGVLSTADNFLEKFGRLYSTSARVVSRLGGAFIAAQQQVGVAATSKHFPGLGAAGAVDTDTAPISIDVSKRTLRSVDEFPYRRAIRMGTRLVMLSNATYPALDPDRPAGLSRPVIQGELRRRLGFDGVTITDALEAGGLENFGSIPNRGVLAAQAGADLLLFSAKDVDEGIQGYEGLLGAYRSRSLNRPQFKRSVERVLRLRKVLASGTRLPPP